MADSRQTDWRDRPPAPRTPGLRPRKAAAVPEALRLQRSAGNAAVTRMLGRPRLQRKIGFELESAAWRCAWLDRAPQGDEETTGAVAHGVATKPPKARTAFYEDGVVRGTADELPGDARDVEFVITEQDESQAGAIGAAFDKVDLAYKAMAARRSNGHWIWPEKRLGWKPPEAKTWLVDNDDAGETIVQLQATAGLPLDQLAAVLKRLDPDATQTTDDPRRHTGLHPGAQDALAYAHSVAGVALEDFLENHPHDVVFADTIKLRGLLALMAQMILGGDPGSDTGAAFSYPKAITALLPRTDFAALFATLDPLQQQALAIPAGPQECSRFLELVIRLCLYGKVGAISKPLLGWTSWRQITLGQIVPDLTREAWAEGILAGQDRLSETGYLAWLDKRLLTGAIADPDYSRRKEEAAQLDSLGSYHAKVDKRGNEDLPLFEFRALVNQSESPGMTVAEAKVTGLRLAAYVERLTARQVNWT